MDPNEGKQSQKVYDLTQKLTRTNQMIQYKKLVTLLQSEIHLLNTIITHLNSALQIYHASASTLATILELPTSPQPSGPENIQTLKTWLKSIEDISNQKIKNDKAESPIFIERVVTKQRPMLVEKIVEVKVQGPTVYVDRIVEVDRPIYIEKIVEVQRPIFVQKKNGGRCIRCLGTCQ